MATYSSDRRQLLKIFGSIGATCAYPFASEELHGQTSAHSHGTGDTAASGAHFFNLGDLATISRIADLIIPETETPGAVSAGVPTYIDYVVGRNTEQQAIVADGLRWLDAEAKRVSGGKFIELSEEQQLSILHPLCAEADAGEVAEKGRNVQCFALLKNLTADGYYTSQVGLMTELQYRGNSPRAAYPAC